MINAVLIDVDNTLLDFNKCAKKVLKSAFEKFGLGYKDQYFFTFKEINDGLWAKIERGEMSKAEHRKLRFKLILQTLGLDDKNCLDMEDFFKSSLSETSEKVDGAEDIVKYLSSKYPLYAATNAPYQLQVKRLKSAGLFDYFTGVFVSEKAGSEKPNKEFYDYCFDNMEKVVPSQAIMIGDSLTADIVGGKDYGLNTCWFMPDRSVDDSDKADYRVYALYEIKNIL